MFLVLVMLIGY